MKFTHISLFTFVALALYLIYLFNDFASLYYEVELVTALKSKQLAAPIHFLETDPYSGITHEKMEIIHATLSNPDIVCAL